jgi:hypothetical protein
MGSVLYLGSTMSTPLEFGYVDSQGDVWATVFTCPHNIGRPPQGETPAQHLEGYYRWVGLLDD